MINRYPLLKLGFILILLFSFTHITNAQIVQVEVLGGAVVAENSTVTINAGNKVDFRITNIETANCFSLKVNDVNLSNTTDFSINPGDPNDDIKPVPCGGGGVRELDFEIEHTTTNDCTTHTTLVTITSDNAADFSFTVEVVSTPVISIVGGNPLADIVNGSTETSSDNATFFGTQEPTNTEDRRYYIVNTGNCPLDITSITSSNGDFAISTPVGPIPPASYSIPSGDTFQFDVDLTVPNTSGEITSTITVGNNSSNASSYTFVVSAEIFDYNIPGPGGITADFRLWLKSTRGITETATKLSAWKDLGTNSKDAIQPVGANQPTYLDDAANNINFNPVIKFENDGAGTEQFLYNDNNGFYSQEIFIVMVPDATMNNASSQNAIFSGISSGNAGDITGVAFGDSSSEFTNETLAYNQDVDGGGSFNGYAELSSSYSDPGIINISNEGGSPVFQDIIYNSQLLTTSSVDDIAYANVGGAGLGTEYWIGKTFDTQGSLNGRVAEILTFAQRLSDGERARVESYLAIKYGITLGAGDQAVKDYKNSFDTKVWDVSQSGSAYNYHVAGIGKDSLSDLNQKQSKTINTLNEVTIGLGGIFAKNSDNTNEFKNDGDFLVWGSNNGPYTGTSTNTVTIATGLTTTVTKIDRKWRIQETTKVSSDVGNVYISIPEAAFSGFSKTADEEYVMIVSEKETFLNTEIYDVIPIKSDGAGNLQTWYDFDGVRFFTFGKTPRLSGDHSINIISGDYLVGESALNLNINAFTISTWVKIAPGSTTRTIMSKGDKLQIRINAQEEVEVMVDDNVTPRFTSDMQLNDSKWHHISFVYTSGTVYLYIDGILDKSEQNVLPPTPNFNKYAVGALFIDKDNISNPLLGEIDEIYIWDQELTEEQVRFLMNQEIERLDISGTDYVQGKVIPGSSVANVAQTIPWSNLKAYYDFDSYYGSTIEGLTDDRNFLRLRYLDKDKTVVANETAPLPYVTTSNGVWNTPAIWANNAVQLLPNSVGLDGTTVIGWNIVEINHEISSGDNDISLNGLISNNAKLVIADPNETLDEDNSGKSLTIRNYIELDGVIDLVGESQLIQTENSIIDADSGGYVERDQQGTASSYHYNYWSSSVGPITGNSVSRGTGVALTNGIQNVNDLVYDGTDTNAYQNIAFSTSAFAADNGPSNPIVISRYWMFKFYGPGIDANAWVPLNEFSDLIPGEGFTMKGTSGAVDIQNDFQNYVFKGLPNNGDILLPLDKNITAQNPTGDVDRLVGNPYPSAIDATEFILDNLSVADGGRNVNGTIINGALYFWDQFGDVDTHWQYEYIGGYATRNLMGGVAAISNDPLVNNTSDAGNPAAGTKVPGPYVPVNQGFFVSTTLDGFDNDNGDPIASVDGGNIVFKNSQRVFEREGVGNSLFLRSAEDQTSSDTNTVQGNPLIRINYHSPIGITRQIALGTNPSASYGMDIGYDAPLIDINTEDMYWLYNENKLVIQGVQSFEETAEFPLGLKVLETGLASIQLEALENLVPDMPIFIKDIETGLTHQLNEGNFEIVLEPGTYENRFYVTFRSSESLSVDENSLDENNLLVYYEQNDNTLNVINNLRIEIDSVTIYNTIGQNIKTWSPGSNRDSLNLNVQSGVYIAQFETEEGKITKRFIVK